VVPPAVSPAYAARVPAAIRSARPEDAQRILAAYAWLFAPPGSQPPTWEPERALAALSALIDAKSSDAFVAEDGDELVGFCTVYRDISSVRFGPRAWVEDLAVHPGHRSRGVGKALLDAAKDWGRARGATHLELNSAEVRTDAHRFYMREQPSGRALNFGWQL
jgi:GNAT superfamily N-acetyltransferase